MKNNLFRDPSVLSCITRTLIVAIKAPLSTNIYIPLPPTVWIFCSSFSVSSLSCIQTKCLLRSSTHFLFFLFFSFCSLLSFHVLHHCDSGFFFFFFHIFVLHGSWSRCLCWTWRVSELRDYDYVDTFLFSL